MCPMDKTNSGPSSETNRKMADKNAAQNFTRTTVVSALLVALVAS